MSKEALPPDEYDVLASVCRESFWEFVQEFWGEIIDEKLVPNWHMEYLCRELEKVADRVFNRQPKLYDLLINIPPATTKSTIVSVMFPIWCWTRCLWVQIICGCFAHPLSLDLSVKGRTILQSEKFKACFPEIVLRSDTNTATKYQNIKGGWRYATSTGGAVTGQHGHINIIDDPVDPRGANSEADLKAANDWLTNVMPKRKVNQANTVTIMIMQRLSQGDPSALWLGWAKQGLPIKHICIPAILTDDVRPRNLRRFYKKGLLDPKRLSREVLAEQELIGTRAYAGQYLQSPMPPGGGMFKTGRIRIESISYSNAKGWVFCRYWDKAATHGGGAYTVGVLMGKDPDKAYWVLDVVRGQWDAGERERIIKQTAVMDGKVVVIRVEQEPGSGGKESAQATIRNLAGYRVWADVVGSSSGNKEHRADPFSAQVNGENVKMKEADWNAEYLKELSFFPDPGYKYKDQVDASSGAFAYLSRPRRYVGAF